MTLKTARLIVRHLSLAFSIWGGRLGLWIGERAVPCLSCVHVQGGCHGCLLRFFQSFASFMAGPASILSPWGLRLASTLVLTAVLWIALGRLWCGWICPFGTVQDWLAGVRARLGLPALFAGPSRILSALRLILFSIVALVPAAAALGIAHPDLAYAFCRICPAGAALPLLAGQAARLDADTANAVTTALSLAGLFWCGLVLAGAFLSDRAYCRVCPMTALTSLLGAARVPTLLTIKKDGAACPDCGRCAAVCPTGLGPEAVRAPECQACGRCLAACPRPDRLRLVLADRLPLARSRGRRSGG